MLSIAKYLHFAIHSCSIGYHSSTNFVRFAADHSSWKPAVRLGLLAFGSLGYLQCLTVVESTTNHWHHFACFTLLYCHSDLASKYGTCSQTKQSDYLTIAQKAD